MGAEDTGLLLWGQAHDLLSKRLRMDEGEYHVAAQRQALKISDFLFESGEALDRSRPDIVTNLGKAIDALNSGIQDTLPAIQESPLGAGITQFIKDDSSLDDAIAENAHDFVDKFVKPYKWYLIGGAALIGLFTVGYTVRAFK